MKTDHTYAQLFRHIAVYKNCFSKRIAHEM